jgi:hypothetical protein
MVSPTYKREKLLPEFLSRYAKGDIPSLQKIILLWVDQESGPPDWLTSSLANYNVSTVIKQVPTLSLNERFRPIPEIETDCVLSLDDDVILEPIDLEQAYQTWLTFGQGRRRMVGFSARKILDHDRYSLQEGPYE